MHQADVVGRDEGVRMLRRDRALGRHPCMSDGVGAGHLPDPEARGDLAGQALVLEHLDQPPVPHDPDIGTVSGDPVDHPAGGPRDAQHRVVRPHVDFGRRAERGGKRSAERVPVMVRFGREQRELAIGFGDRVVKYGEPGAVGAAIGHAGEHRREPGAELAPERGVLEKQSDNAAHRRLPASEPET